MALLLHHGAYDVFSIFVAILLLKVERRDQFEL